MVSIFDPGITEIEIDDSPPSRGYWDNATNRLMIGRDELDFDRIKSDQELKDFEHAVILCVGDIISQRFKKVFDDRGLSVEQEAKKLGNSLFYDEMFEIERHPDGTETHTPKNKLKEYLDGRSETVYGPEEVLQLERHLGIPQFEIATYLKPSQGRPKGLSNKEFLFALDYMELDKKANFMPTTKFFKSPRVKAFYKKQKERIAAEADRRMAELKARTDKLNMQAEQRLKNLKAHALGKWGNKDHNYGR